MGVFLSVLWMVSWIGIGTFAFLAGKTGKRKYLAIAFGFLALMYVSAATLGLL